MLDTLLLGKMIQKLSEVFLNFELEEVLIAHRED
jgi:hypothetical protein